MAIAICGVRVWDGTALAVPPDPLTIRIEHGRIAAIGAGPELSDQADVIAFDAELGSDARAAGLPTAIPGLIDAHVHLTLDPAIADPRRQLEVSREELETALCSRARAMLRAGITTARDLGGGAWHEIALRDRTLRGEVAGPRLLCAGQPVTSPGGHCCFWGGEASDVAAIRSVVRRQIDRGADWVKVMATGGVMTKGTRTTEPQFEASALAALVAEAGNHGRPVAAHCHGTRGIELAAAAGTRTIEHCSFAGADGFGSDLDTGVVRGLAAREALWVSPTVNTGWARRLEKNGQPSPFGQRMSACLQALREAGVPLIASTDAGIPGVEQRSASNEKPARYTRASLRTSSSWTAIRFAISRRSRDRVSSWREVRSWSARSWRRGRRCEERADENPRARHRALLRRRGRQAGPGRARAARAPDARSAARRSRLRPLGFQAALLGARGLRAGGLPGPPRQRSQRPRRPRALVARRMGR
jgi:imidazolonepropionase-like amidohydrolase